MNLLIDPMAKPFCPFRVTDAVPLSTAISCCHGLLIVDGPIRSSFRFAGSCSAKAHSSVFSSPKRSRGRTQSRCQAGMRAEQRSLRIPNELHSHTGMKMIMLGHCSVIIQ